MLPLQKQRALDDGIKSSALSPFHRLGPGYGSAGGGPGEAPWGQGLLMSAGDAALEVRWGR